MSHSLGARMRRIDLEGRLLTAISQAPLGVSMPELRRRFPGEMVAHTLDHLESREQIYLYEGGFYSLTAKGRSRLSPPSPVCVIS